MFQIPKYVRHRGPFDNYCVPHVAVLFGFVLISSPYCSLAPIHGVRKLMIETQTRLKYKLSWNDCRYSTTTCASVNAGAHMGLASTINIRRRQGFRGPLLSLLLCRSQTLASVLTQSALRYES